MIDLEGITYKYFYGATALSNVSIEIKEGDKIAVLGKSSSGKTTLLKIIAKLLSPESGTVTYKKEFNSQYIFSNGGLFKFNTFQSNIVKSLKTLYNKKDMKRKLLAPYNRVSLGFYKTYGFLLEADDIIRLNMERIYQKNADLILVDNIFDLLKTELRNDLFNDHISLFHDTSSTVIFATNCLDEALTIGEKIIFLDNGIIDATFDKNDLNKLSSYNFISAFYPFFNEIEIEYNNKNIKAIYELSLTEEGQEYSLKFHATKGDRFIYKSKLGFIELPNYKGFTLQANIAISKVNIYDNVNLKTLVFDDSSIRKISDIIREELLVS